MEGQKEESKNWISFRVKPGEYNIIHGHFKKTTCRNLSGYARNVLLQKPVVIKYRNRSADDFLTEMVKLKNELNAIGNNFNQSVKRLHTLDKIYEVKTWLIFNEPVREAFMKKTEEIRNRMNQLYEIWSQK
jgi:hypothetical protein